MKNLLVITPTEVTREMLKQFVDSSGGHWVDRPPLDRGVIERGPAVVYVSGETSLLICGYEDHERAALTAILGQPANASVELQIGHAPGSEELAEDIALAIIKRWGGFLDRDIEEIATR